MTPPPSPWLALREQPLSYPLWQRLAALYPPDLWPWQAHGLDALTPAEAFDIYERNARHLDLEATPPHEREVWQALQNAFAGQRGRV